MSPYFTHPLVLTLWSLAIGTTFVFFVLTLSNVSSQRALRRKNTRLYTWFTTFGMLQALAVVLSLLPMPALAKTMTFRAMWIFGAGGLSLWVGAVSAFSGAKSGALSWMRRAFGLIALVVAVDTLVVLLTGQSLMYELVPQATQSVALLATGNVFTHRPLADLLSVSLAVLALVTSALLLRALSRSSHRDRSLFVGVLVTPALFAAEAWLMMVESQYSVPLIFMANLVEATRISWATRDEVFRELSAIRLAREEQALLVESQLEQLKLSARLADVGERTAALSHDIRNPLTAILAGLDLAQHALAQEPPQVKDAQTDIEHIRPAVAHLLALVRRITRQARGTEERAESVPLRDVVEDALSLCQHGLAQVELFQDVCQDLAVHGKRTEVTQVLVNLISNSLDAIENLTTRWIRIDAAAHGSVVQVRIQDSGKRPPDKVLDRFFDSRFTTGTTESSTGLGLTICAQIVQAHGGSLFVDREQANTTLVLELPQAELRATSRTNAPADGRSAPP